jgi:hypothetical protein
MHAIANLDFNASKIISDKQVAVCGITACEPIAKTLIPKTPYLQNHEHDHCANVSIHGGSRANKVSLTTAGPGTVYEWKLL